MVLIVFLLHSINGDWQDIFTAKPDGAYFLSVGDTVFSPPTTDARLTIQFISLPTFHLRLGESLFSYKNIFLLKKDKDEL